MRSARLEPSATCASPDRRSRTPASFDHPPSRALTLPGTLAALPGLTGQDVDPKTRRTLMKKRLLALAVLVSFAMAEMVSAATLAVTGDDQKNVMVTIYNGNLGLVKDVREVRLDRRHPSRSSSWTWPRRSIPPPCISSPSPTRPGSRSSSRTTSTICSRARSSWRSTSARRCGSTRATAPFRRPPCSPRAGPSTRSTARSTWATTASVVLPALPENLVSKPTLVWLLRNQPRRPSGSRPPISPAASAGSPTT